MTSLTDRVSPGHCEDPASALAYARAQKKLEEDAAREVMRAAAAFASMHSEASLVGPLQEWHEHALGRGWRPVTFRRGSCG